MIYLLDTDSLVFMIRGLKSTNRVAKRREQAKKIVKHCQKVSGAAHRIAVSAISVAELEYGARNSSDYDAEIQAVRKTLVPFELFPFDVTNCPREYGMVRESLASSGTPIGAMDLLLAAHALALQATLVNNNLQHFSRVPGLKVANWS